MQEFLAEKREQIVELCRAHHVTRLAVFGSAARDDFDPQRSDVDLLVEFAPEDIDHFSKNFSDLLTKLEALLGRRVDLVTSRSLENPFIIESIREHQERLYVAA